MWSLIFLAIVVFAILNSVLGKAGVIIGIICITSGIAYCLYLYIKSVIDYKSEDENPPSKENNISFDENHYRILKDCLDLIQTTANPDTFFHRYDLAVEKARYLADLQLTGGVDFDCNENFKDIYSGLRDVKIKEARINAMIDRYWLKTSHHILSLKTEKAKQNARESFLKSFEPFNLKLSPSNHIHLQELYNGSSSVKNASSCVYSNKEAYDIWLNSYSKHQLSYESWFKSQDIKIADSSYEAWEKEQRPIADRYFPQLLKIKNDWSEIYQSKNYFSSQADEFERFCKANLQLFLKLNEIDKTYNQSAISNVPAIDKLSLLYFRRKDYESCIDICNLGLSIGVNQDALRSRLIRSLKALKREPNDYEQELLKTNLHEDLTSPQHY